MKSGSQPSSCNNFVISLRPVERYGRVGAVRLSGFGLCRKAHPSIGKREDNCWHEWTDNDTGGTALSSQERRAAGTRGMPDCDQGSWENFDGF